MLDMVLEWGGEPRGHLVQPACSVQGMLNNLGQRAIQTEEQSPTGALTFILLADSPKRHNLSPLFLFFF